MDIKLYRPVPVLTTLLATPQSKASKNNEYFKVKLIKTKIIAISLAAWIWFNESSYLGVKYNARQVILPWRQEASRSG